MSEKKNSRFTAGFLLLLKSNKVWTAIKATKFLKPAITVLTMLLSVFVYSLSLGIVFSIGFVAMIFIHEVGHVVALRRKNIPASLPVFIPFLGAAVFAPKLDDRHDEAYMAYAGPLFGTLGAVGLMLVSLALPHPPVLMIMIVYTALVVNLFNLIPVSPLDGGRVTQAIGPKFVYVGVAVLFILTLLIRTPGMLLIWMIVLMDVPMRPKRRLMAMASLGLLMFGMMLFGVGEAQPWWVNAIDILLASVLIMLEAVFINEAEAGYKPAVQRPQLLPAQRRQWMLLYGALVVALFGMLIWWHGYVPAEALR